MSSTESRTTETGRDGTDRIGELGWKSKMIEEEMTRRLHRDLK
jgi:hypothetical protein